MGGYVGPGSDTYARGVGLGDLVNDPKRYEPLTQQCAPRALLVLPVSFCDLDPGARFSGAHHGSRARGVRARACCGMAELVVVHPAHSRATPLPRTPIPRQLLLFIHTRGSSQYNFITRS